MKALIITVAGSSTRFSRSIGKDCLKCIYYKNDFSESLLYKMIYRDLSFDKYIIIGGYKFAELKWAVENYFKDLADKIILIDNKKYSEFGSGYSLYLGLKSIIDLNFDQVVFAEGDLWFNENSFSDIINSNKNVITFNRESINAKKSVVFYFDNKNTVHYIYDTSHSCLEIKGPFVSIYNSGQVWKFADSAYLNKTFFNLNESEWQGTNLVFIQHYFESLCESEFELIELKQWLNCNTIQDFNKIDEG